MGFVYIFIGMSTLWLFGYKIEWLFNQKSYWANIGYDVFLYVIALVMLYEKIGNPRFVIALKVPLISSIVFRVLYLGFRKIYKRNPENTAWSFTRKPTEDVVFSMLFWLLGGCLPFILVRWCYDSFI